MAGKWLLGFSVSWGGRAGCAPLCWVLFIHRHVIRVFLLFSLWPSRQNACDGVEEGFDLLLCEPFFTLLHHLQKKTSKGYRGAAQAESTPALSPLASGMPSSGPGSRAPSGLRVLSILAPREGEASSNSYATAQNGSGQKASCGLAFSSRNRKPYQFYTHPHAHMNMLYVQRKRTSREWNGTLHTFVFHKHSCNLWIISTTHLTMAHCVPNGLFFSRPHSHHTNSSSGSSCAWLHIAVCYFF